MKIVNIFIVLLFYSISYSQTDEIKLWGKEPVYGKLIAVQKFLVEFRQEKTNLLFEFFIEEVNYLKFANGDTIWFKRDSDDDINPAFDYDLRYIPPARTKKMTLFFSYNFAGIHDPNFSEFTEGEDVNAGISLGAEYDIYNTIKEAIRFGVGLVYQFPRKPANITGSFNFIPVYFFIKFGLPGETIIKPYFVPTIGYNFFRGNEKYLKKKESKGGMYNSVGFGMIYKNNLDLKLLYQFNRGFVVNGSDVVYSSLGLHFGYYF